MTNQCSAEDRGLEPSMYSYQTLGCRCPQCKAVAKSKQRSSRAERIARTKANGGTAPAGVTHGSGAYSNWGCRCQVCCDAWSQYHRAKRHRSRTQAQEG